MNKELKPYHVHLICNAKYPSVITTAIAPVISPIALIASQFIDTPKFKTLCIDSFCVLKSTLVRVGWKDNAYRLRNIPQGL